MMIYIGISTASKNMKNSRKSLAANMPTISVSSTRNAIMYSRTRVWIDFQLATMQTGVSAVESRTNSTEIPSTPMR